jgi:uridine phosphorylase
MKNIHDRRKSRAYSDRHQGKVTQVILHAEKTQHTPFIAKVESFNDFFHQGEDRQTVLEKEEKNVYSFYHSSQWLSFPRFLENQPMGLIRNRPQYDLNACFE